MNVYSHIGQCDIICVIIRNRNKNKYRILRIWNTDKNKKTSEKSEVFIVVVLQGFEP